MKKIIFFTILILIALGFSVLTPTRMVDRPIVSPDSTDWLLGINSTDSETYRMKISRINALLYPKIASDINDTTRASEHRELARFDSINTALRLAMLDSAAVVVKDTLTQTNVIIKNNLKIHDDLFLDAGDELNLGYSKISEETNVLKLQSKAKIAGRYNIALEGGAVNIVNDTISYHNSATITNQDATHLRLTEDMIELYGETLIYDDVYLENDAIISNPTNSLLTFAEEVVSIQSDSTDVGQVAYSDTLKTNRIVMNNGVKLDNSTANTFKVTADSTYIARVAKIDTTKTDFLRMQGNMYFPTANATISQLTNKYTLAVDTFAVRAAFRPNRHRATSPASTIEIGLAGATNQSGADNILIGDFAGDALTTGNLNVFIGTDAGGAATGGAANTFVGALSGKANTASNNTFYGYNSGVTNISGTGNCYFGAQAARYSTGKYNSIFGFAAGNRVTGNGNAFFGNYSGTQGGSSVAISSNACFGDSTGVNMIAGSNANTFIGSYAGLDNTTGKYNIFLGFQAGKTQTTADSTLRVGLDSDELLIGNMTAGVVNRSLDVDGYNYFKHIIGKFKRLTQFVCSAPDVWLTVPIVVANGTGNSWHYTATTGTPADSCIIVNRAQWNAIDATFKVYWGVNTSETVEFRLVKGAVSGGRTYSLCGQQKEIVTKAIGDEKAFILHSDGYFAAGDSLILQMRTSDVGIILKPLSDFANPNSGTLNIKYLGDD